MNKYINSHHFEMTLPLVITVKTKLLRCFCDPLQVGGRWCSLNVGSNQLLQRVGADFSSPCCGLWSLSGLGSKSAIWPHCGPVDLIIFQFGMKLAWPVSQFRHGMPASNIVFFISSVVAF